LGDGKGEAARYAVFLVILVAAAFGTIHILRTALGTRYPLMVVVSQSMVPTLGVGDFIFVNRIDDFDRVEAAPPPEGEILVFSRWGASDEYIVHRAVEKSQADGVWLFVTKGDNNRVSDGRPVPESRVVGGVVGRAPIIGYFVLFVKTSRGLILVAALMAIVFFSDYLMPLRHEEGIEFSGGKFPWASLLPFIAAPLAIASFWIVPELHLEVEAFALASWYVGCFLAPLSFGDDDLCLMFWLYHIVLLVIPLGCDLVWWLTRITPSMWWYVEGSTVPVNWLLMKETPLYQEASNVLMRLILPGCALFLLTMAAKRGGVRPLTAASRWIRSLKSI